MPLTPLRWAISFALRIRSKFPSLNQTRTMSRRAGLSRSSGPKRPVKKPLAWLDHANTATPLWAYQRRLSASDALMHASHIGSFHAASETLGLLATKPGTPLARAYSLASWRRAVVQFDPPK